MNLTVSKPFGTERGKETRVSEDDFQMLHNKEQNYCYWFQPIKSKVKINEISTLSIAELPHHNKWHKLHMISAPCVACDLHAVVPWPLEHTCLRQFVAY